MRANLKFHDILRILRKSGLVSARREGKWMHYKINFPQNPYLSDVLESALNSLESQEDMQHEYKKLVSACCSIEVPVTIAKAPKPKALQKTSITTAVEELETHLL